MVTSSQQIIFTLDEINEILNRLGEIPSKYSFDLLGYIRAKAQEQVNAAAVDVKPEKK